MDAGRRAAAVGRFPASLFRRRAAPGASQSAGFSKLQPVDEAARCPYMIETKIKRKPLLRDT